MSTDYQVKIKTKTSRKINIYINIENGYRKNGYRKNRKNK